MEAVIVNPQGRFLCGIDEEHNVAQTTDDINAAWTFVTLSSAYGMLNQYINAGYGMTIEWTAKVKEPPARWETQFVINVFARLSQMYNFDSSGDAMVREAIARCEEHGYTEQDAYDEVKNCEEVQPDLDEDLALRRMKAVADRVVARTGKDWRKTAK